MGRFPYSPGYIVRAFRRALKGRSWEPESSVSSPLPPNRRISQTPPLAPRCHGFRPPPTPVAENVGAPVPGVPRSSAQHPAQLPKSAGEPPLSASEASPGDSATRLVPGATENGASCCYYRCCCSSESSGGGGAEGGQGKAGATLAKRGSGADEGGRKKSRGGRGG